MLVFAAVLGAMQVASGYARLCFDAGATYRAFKEEEPSNMAELGTFF